jgi:hypothetical protein
MNQKLQMQPLNLNPQQTPIIQNQNTPQVVIILYFILFKNRLNKMFLLRGILFILIIIL